MTRKLPLLALVAALAAGGAWYFGPANEPAGLVLPALAQTEDTGTTTMDAEVEILPDHVLGDENAPVTVIEYASYTCPHCANFHEEQFQELKAEYIDTGKVKFIHREVYFDQYGLRAGLLAQCGGDMRYYGISGMLYDQQKEWIGSGEPEEILDNLVTLGKVAGLSEDEARACMDFDGNDMVEKLVGTFRHYAEADGINATPTLVIDGEKHSNMAYADLKAIIEARLAAQ
ncbi:MAG: DsbA family protein [Paracoccaceae bacterium]